MNLLFVDFRVNADGNCVFMLWEINFKAWIDVIEFILCYQAVQSFIRMFNAFYCFVEAFELE